MCHDSPNQPNIDFKSLQAAVDQVREELGRDNGALVERTKITGAARPDPLRSRYPNFRWRLIPAVYCAFHAAVGLGGLVTHDAYGTASFSGYRLTTIALTLSFLFACASYCWFRSYWKYGILFLALAIAWGRNWIYFY